MPQVDRGRVAHWVRLLLDTPELEREEVFTRLEEEDPRLRPLLETVLAGENGDSETLSFDTEEHEVQFDDYIRLEPLRSGGMSRVYRARLKDDPDGRDYALKVIGSLDPRYVTRFDREKEILQKLRHPQVSRYYEDGTTPDGKPFFAMEFVEGVPIDEFGEHLSTEAVVRLVAKLADPLGEAHSKGIFHRDLKPSNVLVRTDGLPVLIDFGIAKSDSLQYTELGDRAMTYLFGAPEQVSGEDSTTMTDVHGLGMLLYKLLTGRVAYNGESFPEWVRSIDNDDPAPVSVTRAEARRKPISSDLALVIDTAVRKEPSARYPSCKEFADDLIRALTEQPIVARPPSRGYVAKKFVRRHRWGLGVGALALVTSLGMGTFHFNRMKVQKGVAEAARDRAEIAQVEAEVARDRAEVASHNSDVVIATLNQALHLAEKVPDYLEEIPITEMVEITELTRQQLTGEPAARAQLAITVGVVQRDLANYDEAERVLTEAIPNLRPELATVAQTELGATLHRAGRFDEGEDQLETALASCVELGLPCPATLNELALVQADKKDGSLELAEATMRKALAASVAAGVPWETAEAKTNLSIVTGILRRFDEAVPFAEDALRLRKELLPDDHLMVAEAYNNVGTVVGKTGEYETSERYLRLGYEIRLKTLGPSHPWVLESLNNLALCLRRLKRLEEAEQALRTVLAEYAEHYPEHRKRLDAKQNLASLLIELEKFEEAETLLEGILQQRLEIGYGRKIGTAQLMLGKLRLEQVPTKRMQAHTHLVEAERLLIEAYSEKHVTVRETRALRVLASYYRGDATEPAVCLAAADLYAGATQNDDRAVTGHRARLTRHGMECR